MLEENKINEELSTVDEIIEEKENEDISSIDQIVLKEEEIKEEKSNRKLKK